MFDPRYLMAAATAIAAAATIAAAAPYRDEATAALVPPLAVKLEDMLNKTVCAIEVSYDEEEDRVPRRIKTLKCAKATDLWCKDNDVPHEACCHHSSNKGVTKCVQIMDTVLVRKKSTQQITKYDVAVGCACMIDQFSEAETVKGPT